MTEETNAWTIVPIIVITLLLTLIIWLIENNYQLFISFLLDHWWALLIVAIMTIATACVAVLKTFEGTGL